MAHPLVERLTSADAAARRDACRAAADDPSAVLLVEALAERLADADREVVRAASDALVFIARHDDAVAPLMRSHLRSADPRARWGAAVTSARLGPPEPRLLPVLVENLDADDGTIRWAASRTLVDAGRLHDEVLPMLLGLVRSGESPGTRRMAAHCLRELAPDLPETAAALVGATSDGDLAVRRAAFTALAKLLDPPDAVAARLVAGLEDDDPVTCRIAAHALGALGPEVANDAVREALGRAAASGDDALARLSERALSQLS